MYAVDVEFIVQVRSCRQAGAADIGNGLALFDFLANTDFLVVAVQVCIQSSVLAAVLDLDVAAITTILAFENDLAVAGCVNRCTAFGGIVHALVGAPFFKHRVVTLGCKAGADAGEVHRHTQEFLAHALAFGREIFCAAGFRVGVPDRAIDIAVVNEFGGKNFAVLDFITVAVDFFV